MIKHVVIGLVGATVLSAAALADGALKEAAMTHQKNISVENTAAVTPRPAGSIYMGGFRAPAIECVRVAVIGLGERGLPQTEHLCR